MKYLKPVVAILIAVSMLASVITTASMSSWSNHLSIDRQAENGLIAPLSDHIFDFEALTAAQQEDKPFGYGPYWDIDSSWGANAWRSDDITVRDGADDNRALAISATFDLSNDTHRKGFIVVDLPPNLNISNKDNRVIRAQVKFDPAIELEQMVGSIYLYDRRDAGECASECKWYRSLDTSLSGSDWNEIVFDLSDSSQFGSCSTCLRHRDITTDSLKNIVKVGIQFFANNPYSGTIYLDNISIGGTENDNFVNLNQGVVTRNGTNFMLNNQPYRFTGNHSYYLFYKSHYMIDDLMATMQRNNLRVLRSWGFGDIPDGSEGSAFQPQPGLYYEPTFAHFDYVVKSAGEHGIRLIIPLVNHWSDFGGMEQYVQWCDTNKAQFYTNECTKQLYKNYITHMINRVNTLTGVPYKEDPTILAWELANEPRCEPSDGCPSDNAVYEWAVEMSAHIKKLDPNHLVALGDEGFLNEPKNDDDDHDPFYDGSFGLDWERNLSIETIDFGTVHLYPNHWNKTLTWSETWITDHINIAQQMGKPVVFEEFGVCHDEGNNNYLQYKSCSNTFDRDAVYTAWTDLFERGGVAGSLVWMIAGQVNDAHEANVKIDNNYYYPNYDGYIFWEPSSTMKIIREHATCMNDDVGCKPARCVNDQCLIYLPLAIKKGNENETPVPSATPTPTAIITGKPPFDFEGNRQGWGKHPNNQLPEPCEGVTVTTEIAHTGDYSLKFDDLGPYSGQAGTTQDIGLNYDACGTLVSAHVFLPVGAPSIPVTIYVQDGSWTWHESDPVELIAGQWNTIEFDMRGESWPTPCRTLGLHFTPGDYTGPVYIDMVRPIGSRWFAFARY